ncbi:hypothetical protein DLD77_09480 [Chitinophaga alhagiae]|uniref:T9SS C-terminal target domain-containing protein n=1 Tax=Chitinophaga alhagiae TaxID=2203219 RepID=A0ABN5LRC8_9BACT|nr:hypothetical protein [Chitinophaga alhagiae]AWO01912.1 hypothetical protein DLD77_09480 [Chitinophaga alhagiae]
MKLTKFLAFLFGAAVLFSACRKNDDDDDTDPDNQPEVLSGNISQDKRLTNDKVWILKGYVYVTAGATLTIDAGTIIKSEVADINKGALIVERGAKIIAAGTSTSPIVFTSGKEKGQRTPGDWGGVIILGKAPINRTDNPNIEGGVGRPYGGTDPEDNSGVFSYVRIEYAGVAAQPNSEINGLTLGGVGNKTQIDHVQVLYGNDDAFEFFGGTVNAKYLVAIGTADDDFDFDNGFSGTIQYAVAMRYPQIADPGDASNLIECDNDGSGTTANPRTRPVLSNLTLIGPNNAANTHASHNYGNRWRRATNFVLVNSIIMGAQKGGFSIESNASGQDMKDDKSVFKNNIVHALAKPYLLDSAASRAVVAGFPADPLTAEQRADLISQGSAWLKAKAEANGCVTLASADEVGLTAPFNLTAPNFLPQTGSKALEGTFASLPGLEAVTYRGAFAAGTNWMQGWTTFDPQNETY